ncbi:MAG: DUF1456 family protein [Fibrobacterota bacterium]
MTNNNILRRLRYALDFDDSKVISIFKKGDLHVTRAQTSDWLKKDDDESFVPCSDKTLAIFLNGLIIDRRGKKEGPQLEPENKLTNNIVFRKLRIALNLQSEDIMEILASANCSISKHELSAFFRKREHRHYRKCKDQVLRNFLQGLSLRFHS